jgi:hypothetical protein
LTYVGWRANNPEKGKYNFGNQRGEIACSKPVFRTTLTLLIR